VRYFPPAVDQKADLTTDLVGESADVTGELVSNELFGRNAAAIQTF
jgi:hypothetical protein